MLALFMLSSVLPTATVRAEAAASSEETPTAVHQPPTVAPATCDETIVALHLRYDDHVDMSGTSGLNENF